MGKEGIGKMPQDTKNLKGSRTVLNLTLTYR
jgi:hypothetical protein